MVVGLLAFRLRIKMAGAVLSRPEVAIHRVIGDLGSYQRGFLSSEICEDWGDLEYFFSLFFVNTASIAQLAEDLSGAKSAEDFHGALRRALGAYDALNTARVEESGVTLVCRAGCSLCCWLRVDVYAPEVFLIADALRTELSPVELLRLRERLAAHAGVVTRLTVMEHATRNVACPLSREGWCSIYAVRPHTCRRHHSRDLAACQFTFDHPEDLEFPGAHSRVLFEELTEAMGLHAAVYEYLGYDATIYELGSALEEALADAGCWRRWQRKKKAFRRASVTPAG